MMAPAEAQGTWFKFCSKLNETATETYQIMVETFGDETLSKLSTFEWLKCIQVGRRSVKIDPRVCQLVSLQKTLLGFMKVSVKTDDKSSTTWLKRSTHLMGLVNAFCLMNLT